MGTFYVFESDVLSPVEVADTPRSSADLATPLDYVLSCIQSPGLCPCPHSAAPLELSELSISF